MARKMSAHTLKQRSAKPEDKLLGEAIRSRRIEANMSQSDLGHALGVSFQQVQKYEKGVNRVSVTRLHQIARAMGEDVTYFTKSAGAPTSKLTSLLTDNASQRLLRAFHKIEDHDTRYKVVNLLESIVQHAA